MRWAPWNPALGSMADAGMQRGRLITTAFTETTGYQIRRRRSVEVAPSVPPDSRSESEKLRAPPATGQKPAVRLRRQN